MINNLIKKMLLFFIANSFISLTAVHIFDEASHLIIKNWDGDVTITQNDKQAQAVVVEEAGGGIIEQINQQIICRSPNHTSALKASINQPYLALCIEAPSHTIALNGVKGGLTVIITDAGRIELNETIFPNVASIHTQSGKVIVIPPKKHPQSLLRIISECGDIELHHANRLKQMYAYTVLGTIFKNNEATELKKLTQEAKIASSLAMHTNSGNIFINDN